MSKLNEIMSVLCVAGNLNSQKSDKMRCSLFYLNLGGNVERRNYLANGNVSRRSDEQDYNIKLLQVRYPCNSATAMISSNVSISPVYFLLSRVN